MPETSPAPVENVENAENAQKALEQHASSVIKSCDDMTVYKSQLVFLKKMPQIHLGTIKALRTYLEKPEKNYTEDDLQIAEELITGWSYNNSDYFNFASAKIQQLSTPFQEFIQQELLKVSGKWQDIFTKSPIVAANTASVLSKAITATLAAFNLLNILRAPSSQDKALGLSISVMMFSTKGIAADQLCYLLGGVGKNFESNEDNGMNYISIW